MSRIALFLTLLVGASIVGLLIIGFNWQVNNLATETYKALLQLVVVAVAGHVVSILITKANNERQDLIQANTLRANLMDKLNKAFVDVKRVRRIARGTSTKVVTGKHINYFIVSEKFHEYLQVLNDVQLELELVAKDIESNKTLFPRFESLKSKVDSMEDYLNRIVSEYENSIIKPLKRPANCFAVAGFPYFSDLLGSYIKSKFRPKFVHTYYESLDEIRDSFSKR